MTEVTKQERLLFGSYAGAIRRLGQAAANAEEARALLDEIWLESSKADEVTNKVSSAKFEDEVSSDDLGGEHVYDRKGRSPHTLFMVELVERASEVEQLATEVYRDIALRIAGRVRAMRMAVPASSGRPPAPVTEKPTVE